MGWRDGFFGNETGDGPQWSWAAKGWDVWNGFSDQLFGRDEMSEVDRAIAHNEARGDPVPDDWYTLSDQGVPTFDWQDEE